MSDSGQPTPVGILAQQLAEQHMAPVRRGTPLREELVKNTTSLLVARDYLEALCRFIEAGKLTAVHPITGRRFDPAIDKALGEPMWALSAGEQQRAVQLLGLAETGAPSPAAPVSSDFKREGQAAAPPMEANGKAKRWTDEFKAEVRAYRDKHGLTETAKHFGVSQALISRHVPAGNAAKPLDVWSALKRRK